MEAYPSYRCGHCGGHSNMMGTGHWAPAGRSGFICEKAPTRGLLEPVHYDCGPELSVDYDQRAKRFERHYKDADGRFCKEPISELEAFDLAALHFPNLVTEAKQSLRARLEAEAPPAGPEERAPGRFRPSALAETP